MRPGSRRELASRISALHREEGHGAILMLRAYPNFVFQDVGEVVLQLRAAKVAEDLRPFGRVCKAAEVGFLFVVRVGGQELQD